LRKRFVASAVASCERGIRKGITQSFRHSKLTQNSVVVEYFGDRQFWLFDV